MDDINSFKKWLEKKSKKAKEQSRANISSRGYHKGESDAFDEVLAQLLVGDVQLVRVKWEQGKPHIIPTDWDFTEENGT